MNDENECRLTGTVERVKPVQTKSGATMAEVLLKVRQDRFRVVAHGNVAEHLLTVAGPDDRLSLMGTIQPSNWKDESTGAWHNSFSVAAWAVEIHGGQIAYLRKQSPGQRGFAQNQRRDEIPIAQPGDPF